MTGVHAFETPGKVALRVRLSSGRVVVTVADEPRTTVDVVGAGRDAQGDEVVVRADERPGGHEIVIEEKERFRLGPIQITWGRDIVVHVSCPPGADLHLVGGSTDVSVTGDLGMVAIKTASGDVGLGTVRGKLEVKTASGDVSVDAAEGESSIQTVSGDLGIAAMLGSLTARAVSGDAHVRTVRGLVTLSTTSGEVTVDSVEAGELRLQTVSGDVRVGVGKGTRVWIDAASISGDLGSELGLADEVLEGDDAGEVVPLHVKTVSGDVAIVRAAEAFSS